jgi:hypothetical protein
MMFASDSSLSAFSSCAGKIYGCECRKKVCLRRAARSSGEAFFLTSCSNRMAASKSSCVLGAPLGSERSFSLAVEPCLPPKHDSEFDLELVRELARELAFELDRDNIDKGRPRERGASSPIASSSLLEDGAEPSSVSMGDKSASLILYRPFALRSAYLELTDTGESVSSVGAGEFVFVFGFANRLWWWGVLWLLPMMSRYGMLGERERPV